MVLPAFDFESAASAPWTADMVREFPERLFYHYQLVDGVLVMTPSPARGHQDAGTKLTVALSIYLGRLQRENCVKQSPADISWEQGVLVQPDVFVVAPDEAELEWKEIKTLLLAVEVVSPSSKKMDYEIKRDICMRHGVREYWVVDLSKHQVEIWRQGQATPETVTQTLIWHPDPLLASRSMAMPDPFVIDITKLW